MKKTNILKTKLKRLIESEVRNVLREEEDIDIETSIAKEFADAVKTELEDELPVEEAVGVVALLSVILFSNTVSNMLSKLVSKLSKKYQWEKLENASEDLKANTEIDIQVMTDNYIKKVDAIYALKEQEIMTV